MRLSDLFDIKNGHGLDLVNIEHAPWGTGLAYVSCADKDNGVTGWVREIDRKVPAAAGTISVALTGNSVMSAFIQASPYYTASHMAILTPKDATMSFAEKLWWAQCIRANRYRFGFGRKADRTIRDLLVPDAVPAWVTNATIKTAIHDLAEELPSFAVAPIRKVNRPGATVDDLFRVERGHGLDLVHLTQVPKRAGVAYVSRSQKNNGVLSWVKEVDGIEPARAGTISVALGGSVMSAFVQPYPYYTAQNVDVLTPKTPMMLAEMLWWAECIRANRYRYNYGRHANRTFHSLVLPDTVPTWVKGVPHDAVEELRGKIEDVAESIDEPSEFENFADLAGRLFQLPKSAVKR